MKVKLQRFSADEPLKSVGVGILEQLSCNTKGNQYVIVEIDLFTKLTRAILEGNTTATYVADIFFESSIIPNSTSSLVLTDNGVDSTSNPFAKNYAKSSVLNIQ